MIIYDYNIDYHVTDNYSKLIVMQILMTSGNLVLRSRVTSVESGKTRENFSHDDVKLWWLIIVLFHFISVTFCFIGPPDWILHGY